MKTTIAALLFPTFVLAQGFAPTELVVEAIVDGPGYFHVRPEGVYWESGHAAKPGKWNGRNEPTYVNGTAWMPRWGKSREDRGKDRTELYRVGLGSVDLEFELLAVTKKQGESGIEKRTEVASKVEGNEFIVTIPDPEPEARWYKFVIRKRAKGQK